MASTATCALFTAKAPLQAAPHRRATALKARTATVCSASPSSDLPKSSLPFPLRSTLITVLSAAVLATASPSLAGDTFSPSDRSEVPRGPVGEQSQQSPSRLPKRDDQTAYRGKLGAAAGGPPGLDTKDTGRQAREAGKAKANRTREAQGLEKLPEDKTVATPMPKKQ
eukprot:jgi/Chlat1/4177/Chrsp27S08875